MLAGRWPRAVTIAAGRPELAAALREELARRFPSPAAAPAQGREPRERLRALGYLQ